MIKHRTMMCLAIWKEEEENKFLKTVVTNSVIMYGLLFADVFASLYVPARHSSHVLQTPRRRLESNCLS